MTHDFDAQREETMAVWAQLSESQSMPASAVLELQFVPLTPAADWAMFEADLAAAGFKTSRYEDDDTLEASIGPINLSAQTIWQKEFAASKLALERGFKPDGWGFMAG